jgi:riboflavin synthase
VSLIPETLARTTLGVRMLGEQVNLEVDVIAKYVERMIGVRQDETNRLVDDHA